MLVNSKLVAFVTGGGGGLGSAAVKRLLGLGAKVAAMDTSDEYLESLLQDVGPSSSLLPIQGNVRRESDVEAAVEQTLRTFGSLHAAIPCAGIVKATPFTLETSWDMGIFKECMDVNVMGTVYTAMYAAMAMKENEPTSRGERGSITMISSICASEGGHDLVAYSGSKAALQGMMLPMARDLRQVGIRVNCIAAGSFETNIYRKLAEELGLTYEEFLETCANEIFAKIPVGKSEPEDFAHTVQYLIENRYVNAASIRLDGGMRL